jgi:hypothetical protein
LDINVFEGMKIRPKLVAIEGGFSWHPKLTERIPDTVAAQTLHQPLQIAIASVRSKGYEPICFNQNLYAIRGEYFELFKEIVNDPVTLWLDAYYYQTSEFRQWLQTERASNKLILEYEKGYAVIPESADLSQSR